MDIEAEAASAVEAVMERVRHKDWTTSIEYLEEVIAQLNSRADELDNEARLEHEMANRPPEY